MLAKAASREDLAGAVIAETPRVLCGVALSFDGDSAYYLPLPALPPPWSFDDGGMSRAAEGERARPTAPREASGARPVAAAMDEPSVSSRVVGFAYGDGAFRWLATLSTDEDERRAKSLRGLREPDDRARAALCGAHALSTVSRAWHRAARRALVSAWGRSVRDGRWALVIDALRGRPGRRLSSDAVVRAEAADAASAAAASARTCLLYTSPSPRDGLLSRMPSSA